MQHRPPCRGRVCVAVAIVLWSVCQPEAPLHPLLCLTQMGWRLMLLGLDLGACALVLRSYLRGSSEVVAAVSTRGHYSCCSPEPLAPSQLEGPLSLIPSPPECFHSLARTLADSLVLCLLQEPLLEPTKPHIQALLCRLEAVSQALEPVSGEIWLEEISAGGSDCGGRDLMQRLRHLLTYLQQRASRLERLLQDQGKYEARLRDLRGGLEQFWTRLEQLHTRVTLTKERGGGHEDLHSVQKETLSLSTELSQCSTRLECCQTQLKKTTLVLLELAWSHNHTGVRLSTNIESMWPEVLQQSNMKEFDEVQQRLLSLEQQTYAFQAHLHGLRDTSQGRQLYPTPPLSGQPPATPPGYLTPSPSPSPSPSLTPVPPPVGHLREWKRSALHFSSTIGCFSSRRRRRKSYHRDPEVTLQEGGSELAGSGL